MIRVDQTMFGHPGGNCYSACLASLLEMPCSDVPYFMGGVEESDGRWAQRVAAWLKPLALYPMFFNIVDPEKYEREKLWPKGYFILCGRSSRGDHAVVAREGMIVHDPHPSREGLISSDAFTILLPFDYAVFGSTT
jgi:hypothetical protein